MEPGEAPRGYLRVIAQSVGVPVDLHDDCIQEQVIAIWQAPDIGWKIVAKRAAQDFVRRYLWDPRIKTPHPSSLDIADPDFEDALEDTREDPTAGLDGRERHAEACAFLCRVLAAIESLPPRERECLLAQGLHPGEAKAHGHHSHVKHGREKLRALVPERPNWW